jgi:hypothetical protein
MLSPLLIMTPVIGAKTHSLPLNLIPSTKLLFSNVVLCWGSQVVMNVGKRIFNAPQQSRAGGLGDHRGERAQCMWDFYKCHSQVTTDHFLSFTLAAQSPGPTWLLGWEDGYQHGNTWRILPISWFICWVETGSCYGAQAGLQLQILLPQPPK